MSWWQDLLEKGAKIALPGPGAGIATSVAKGAVSTVQGAASAADQTVAATAVVGSAIGKTTLWVSNAHNWVRVAYVVGGSAIFVAGLVMLVEQTKTGQAATKAAIKGIATKGIEGAAV